MTIPLLKEFITNFPSGIGATVTLVITFIVSVWPRVWEVIKDHRTWNKAIYWERQRLEMLNLCYQIEALKKDSDLGEINKYPASPEFDKLLDHHVMKINKKDVVKPSLFRLYIIRGLYIISIIMILLLLLKHILI